jgi:hypothetical protein
MLTGTGSLSLRKSDLENQKVPAVGFIKTTFAHKATAGQTGINLTSLTLPTEMSTNGFSNPPTSQLTNAQLLFHKNNLTLVSSARGLLQQGLSYTVATSTQINFLGFTALEGEIFTGTIDYTAQTGIKVVDASPINATGTLAATTTDFNVGVPFKVGQYSTTQIGAVLVFVDGIIQFRNTGNSSVTLDGNYREVDAGGGLGTIIRFNVADPTNARNILVVSNGLLSERPDGSMMAVIENVNGQLQNMAPYVAALAGQTTATVLGAAPSNVDLKSFGDRVVTLETSYPARKVTGDTSGTVVPAGYIGERVFASTSSTYSASTTLTTYSDVTGLSITITAGVWHLYAILPLQMTWQSGSGTATAVGFIRKSDNTNIVAAPGVSINSGGGPLITGTASMSTIVSISATTTYKASVAAFAVNGSPVINVLNCYGGLGEATIYAIRIA